MSAVALSRSRLAAVWSSRLVRPTHANQAALSTLTSMRYICESCGFIYDPEEGDPDGGVLPGTAFEDIPETWYCPVCGARKADFVPYED